MHDHDDDLIETWEYPSQADIENEASETPRWLRILFVMVILFALLALMVNSLQGLFITPPPLPTPIILPRA